MTTSTDETVLTTFTSEQRHVLGMLYAFLIQLGQQRLRRLEQESLHQEKQVDNQCEDTDVELRNFEK